MVATTLAAGGLAIIGYNTGQSVTSPATEDRFSFVLLQPIGSGTQIFFTDRAWTGAAFTTAGGDGTFTYTAGTDLAAGTVITVTQAQLLAGGFDISESGETIYAYQGAINAPTTFLYAADIADGNTTFNGSLANTGLTAGVTAVAIAYDAAAYAGPTTHAESFLWNGSTLLQSIADSTNWTGDNADGANAQEQEIQTGPWLVHADVEFWGAMGSGGLANTLRDATYISGNDDYNHTRQYEGVIEGQTIFWSARDIIFDTVDGKFFVVDSDITGGNNRILQGNISDLIANPTSVPNLTILYSDVGTTTASRLDNIDIDLANNIVYFTHGGQLLKVNYNTAGQTPTVLLDANVAANLAGSTNNFFNDMVINFATGSIYLSSTRVLAGASGDVVSRNFIYELTGLTTASGTNAFTFNGTNSGTARLLPFAQNDDSFNPNGGTTASPATAANQAYFWPLERGTLDGLAINPLTNTLYFSTGEILFDHDLNSGSAPLYAGGVIGSYALGANAANGGANAAIILYQQTAQFGGAIPGLMGDLEIDVQNGQLYVLDTQGINGVNDDNHWFKMNLDGTGIVQFTQTIGDLQGTATVGLTLNHAPTLTGTGLNAATNEVSIAPNSGETFRVLLFSGITISDVDTSTADEISGAVIRISNNLQTGATHQDFLRINNLTSGTIAGSGINFTYDSVTGALVLTGAATVAEYKAAIELVTFSSSGDDVTAFGSATTRQVAVSVSDGLTMSDEIFATVTVTGINDAPVNTAGVAMNFTEDTVGNSVSGPPVNAVTGISVFDVDANPATQDITVTLSVATGTLTIRTDVAGGLAAIEVSGNGTNTLVLTGTQNQINATLAAVNGSAVANGLVYTPPLNFNGATTLSIVTNDGGFSGNDPGMTGTGTSESDSDTKIINIAAVNDAPTVAGDGTESAPTILEDAPSAAGQTVASLFSGQYSDVADAQFSVSNPSGSSPGAFSGIAVVANGSSGATGQWQWYNTVSSTWTDIGAASAGAAKLFTSGTALRFNPSLNFNGAAPTLTVHLIDNSLGFGIANGQFVNISGGGATGGTTPYSTGTVVLSQTVTAVNDAPVNSLGGTIGTGEDAIQAWLSGMSISDPDANPAIDDVFVTFNVANGTLLLRTDVAGGITLGDIIAQSVDTITVLATLNQINATLAASNGLTYTPDGNYNGSDTLTVTTNDGGATGLDPGVTGDGTSEADVDTRTITISAVNDAPAGADNFTLTFNEDGSYTLAEADFGFNDVDGNTFAGVVITTLPTNGTLRLNGTAISVGNTFVTAAQIAAGQLVFQSEPDENGSFYDTLTFQVRDNGGTANGGQDTDQSANTLAFNVTAVNDPPVLALADSSVVGKEDTNLVFSAANGNAITVSDIDSSVLTVTLSVAQGSLTLSQTTGLSFSNGDGTGDASMTFSGTAANINTALNGLVYRGNLDYEGSDTLGIVLGDGTDNVNGNVAITLLDQAAISGTAGNDNLMGTPQADFFDLSAGGTDTASGLASNDGFYFGAALDPTDSVDGGAGNDDQVGLQGNYAGLVINAANFAGIETFALLGGNITTFGDTAGNFYDYNITTTGSFGRNIIVNANGLRAGEDFTFNGSAEATGSFTFYGGFGVETLTGGAGNDGFYFGPGRFGAGDSVNGGGGIDNQLGLRGDYVIDFNAPGFTSAVTNIQTIALLSDMDPNFTQIGDGEFDYALVLSDNMVGAGQQLTVSGGGLGATETMQVNGSAETNGTLRLIGGAGNDVLTGGAGADQIFGGLRGDTLTGGAGNDVFRYDNVAESNSTERDGIQDFNSGDLIDLSRIDANTAVAGDQAFSFIGSTAFSNTAGELRFENISLGGPIWLVQGDINGDGVSDWEAVLVINPPDPITSGDFLL